MAKPLTKIESNWLYWRNHHPNRHSVKRGYSKWCKNQMNKAIRRYNRDTINDEKNKVRMEMHSLRTQEHSCF